MAAAGLPVADGGQPPTLGVVGEPPDQHPQQPGAPRRRLGRIGGRRCRCAVQLELHQQGAALQPGAPAGEVKGEVEGFTGVEGPGERIVAPGGEIGPGGREVAVEQTDHGGHGLGHFQRSDLIGRVHAVSPEQNRSAAET